MPYLASEAHGTAIHEAPGQQGQHMYGAQGPQGAAQGVGWQSGPVNSYHEMDGGWQGRGQQPPR
jgi:hypothetical protein